MCLAPVSGPGFRFPEPVQRPDKYGSPEHGRLKRDVLSKLASHTNQNSKLWVHCETVTQYTHGEEQYRKAPAVNLGALCVHSDTCTSTCTGVHPHTLKQMLSPHIHKWKRVPKYE